ncbi:MAG: TerB family tellurite resistance protein [Myxococcota bacterium]
MRSLRTPILTNWLADPDIQALGDGEIKVIIDALALVMYADMDISQVEEHEYENLIATFPLPEEEERWTTYSREAITRALQPNDDQYEARARELASVVPAWARAKVYGMLVTVSVADRTVTGDEEDALAVFADAFGFDDAQAHTLFIQTLASLNLTEEDTD